MNYLRTLNVITLSLLLILTGCFGLLDDEVSPPADGQDTTTETATATEPLTAQDIADALTLATNTAPQVSIKTFMMDPDELSEVYMTPSNWGLSGTHICMDEDEDTSEIPATLAEQQAMLTEDGSTWTLANLITEGSCIVYIDFMAVDPDGDAVTKGVDYDFDGVIDVPFVHNSGITLMAVPGDLDQDVFEMAMMSECLIMDFAFIAVDEHGASTSEFFHTLNRDGCEGVDGYTDGNLALYAFSGEDAQGTPSDGTDDNLIMLTMTQGGDINWASISVKLQVDGGAPVTCDNPGGSGGVCVLEEFGTTTDQVWSVGDGVTIKETGTDLCTASCTIDVTITDTREGKVIDETNGVPAE
jgi:hypothetical protein